MKKFFIFGLFLLFSVFFAAVNAKTADVLSKMENSVFGTNYPNQKTETRLTRLEKIVYGKQIKGKNQARLAKLSKDMNADLIGQECINSEETKYDDGDFVADSSVDYPVIDSIEKNLNIKQTSGKTLHSRLVTIEKKLFNNVYDTDDFYTRVERIKRNVYKNNDVIAQDSYDDICFDDDYVDYGYADDGNDTEWNLDKILNRSGKRNMSNKLAKLEKKVFDMTYANQNTDDRLTRLEREIFKTEFYEDNETDRLSRLEGAVKGQKTAGKYDSNKFQQHLNTAMQIGAMILMVLACIL